MTTTLEKAIEQAKKSLTTDRQEHIGKVILDLVELEAAQPQEYILTPDDHVAIEEGIQAANAGDFATPEEVAEVFNTYR